MGRKRVRRLIGQDGASWPKVPVAEPLEGPDEGGADLPAAADDDPHPGHRILSWRVSDTMDVEFCIKALEEALEQFGRPGIFNSDQGSQFTSPRFTCVLQAADVRTSMDGRRGWMDNVFIERLWRSLKYECIYLHPFETGMELRAGHVAQGSPYCKWPSLFAIPRRLIEVD